MRKEDTAGQAAGHRNPKDHWKGGIGVEVIQRLAVFARSAVARILVDSERELTKRFLALTTHYLVEASFARPRTGWNSTATITVATIDSAGLEVFPDNSPKPTTIAT